MVLRGEEGRRQRDIEKEAVVGECSAISKASPCPDLEKERSDGKWICIWFQVPDGSGFKSWHSPMELCDLGQVIAPL